MSRSEDTRGGLATSDKTKQPKDTKSLPSVRHKHDWRLIDKGDTQPKYRPLPEGKWVSRGGWRGGLTYIPGFDETMFYEHLIDTINSSGMPYDTWQKWQCPDCGEIKEHWQHHKGLNDLMADRADDKGSDLVATDPAGSTELSNPPKESNP